MKAIPGAAPELIARAGYLADRMSVNLELPTADGLRKLAPHKSRQTILRPMKQIQQQRDQNKEELVLYRHAPKFVPAGQSTPDDYWSYGGERLSDRVSSRIFV